MGAAMCTNGRGTNSVNPPVSACRARVRSRCLAQCRGDSTWPNRMVMLERSPAEWATRWTSSHSSVVTLSGQMTGPASSSGVCVAGARAGRAAPPGRLELQQGVAERLAEPAGALVDLQGGEAVDVHARHGLAHGPGQVGGVGAVGAGGAAGPGGGR